MSAMILTALALLFAFLQTCAEGKFHPKKFDYCKLNCKGVVHAACNCRVAAPREVITKNLGAFRKDVVNEHNLLRNLVASGGAQKQFKEVQSASNMMIMNYDGELEHLARCLAGKFNEEVGACREDHDGKAVGQNIKGHFEKDLSARKMIKAWFDEIKFVKWHLLLNFTTTTTSEGAIGNFTQLIWSSMDRLGCARVWNPKASRDWKYSLICNYASTRGLAPNTVGTAAYAAGKPCSSCPSGTECQTDKYPALCGGLLSIDEDDEGGYNPFAGAEGNCLNIVLSEIAVVLFFIF